jgi:hypothetical protein
MSGVVNDFSYFVHSDAGCKISPVLTVLNDAVIPNLDLSNPTVDEKRAIVNRLSTMCYVELEKLCTEAELTKLCNLHWSEWNNYAIQHAKENHFKLPSRLFTRAVDHAPLAHHLTKMREILPEDSILHDLGRWASAAANPGIGSRIPFDFMELVEMRRKRPEGRNQDEHAEILEQQSVRFVIGQLVTGYKYEHSEPFLSCEKWGC